MEKFDNFVGQRYMPMSLAVGKGRFYGAGPAGLIFSRRVSCGRASFGRSWSGNSAALQCFVVLPVGFVYLLIIINPVNVRLSSLVPT